MKIRRRWRLRCSSCYGARGRERPSNEGMKATSSMDDLRHAWAVLDLPAGSSIDKVRSNYRQLARRWHPDRFANDPRNQAEAAVQMRVINAAYRRLLEAAAVQRHPAALDGPSRPSGRRLSREEIDRLVAAIGTESWVESGLSAMPYWHATDWLAYRRSDNQWAITPSVAYGLVYLVAWLVIGVLEWSGRPLPKSAAPYLGIGMVVVGIAAAYWLARHEQD